MRKKKTVCVYCGASPRVDDKFKQAASETAAALAEINCDVVYGGGNSGLMGIIADTAIKSGSHVTGIIPNHLTQREIMHPDVEELHVVSSMHERKAMMANLSDVFLILPGGLGTMDEFFEILTWKQLGLHDKTIIVYNVEKYWENLKLLIENINKESFMKSSDTELFYFCNQLDDVITLIKEAPFSEKNVKEEEI